MFDQPLALLLGLLAVPWVLWARQHAPRPWPVGGLGPFEGLTRQGGARRRWPLSLWCGALGLLAGALAAAGPRGEQPAPILVIDGSLSAQNHDALAGLVELRSMVRADHLERTVGGLGAVVREEELAVAISAVGGRRVGVFTDRPEPRGLPGSVTWFNQSFENLPNFNVAILNVLEERDAFEVFWDRWGSDELAVLEVDGRVVEELEDPSLPVRVPAVPRPRELRVRFEVLEDDRSPQDDAWTIDREVVFRIPVEAHANWEDALVSIVPGAVVVRGTEAVDLPRAEERVVRFDPESTGLLAAFWEPLVFDRDPFLVLDELDAVAEVHRRLNPWLAARGGIARPRVECAPPDPSLRWDWEGDAPEPAPGKSFARPVAAAGLLLYLLALGLRARGR